jgi:acyl carrier protein
MKGNGLTATEFYRCVEEVLDVAPGTLEGGEKLAEIEGWDSMAVLGFLAMADQRYSAIIPPRRIPECRTVDDLADLIQQYAK